MEQPTDPIVMRPYTGAHFLVDLGVGNSRNADKGFCEVVFPDFRIDRPERAGAADLAPDGSHSENKNTGRRLILRRGVTGSLDLYTWWNEARRDKTLEGRTIKVQLMTADLSSVVLTWYFRGAHPICLSYTPLNALQATVF